MADEHNPPPSPQSSSGFTTPSAITPPSENANGVSPASNGQPSTTSKAPAGARTGHSSLPELAVLGRWFLGLLLVLVCGWGLLGLAFYFLFIRSHVERAEIVFAVIAALDLVLFLFLEKDFWLSHFMGLRIEPGSHFWQSAFMLWLLGVPGLLFRSTNFRGEAAAAAPQPAPRPRPQPTQHSDSVREVVETIVFVVVLVLLLKSFAAEAFVIPTGSMAQTLLGYQKEVTCPDCGIKFPINCSQEVDPSEGRPSSVYACVCPNCRQRIHFPSAPRVYTDTFRDSIPAEDPGWNSGDRVLVAKFVYDLLGKAPDRLDVVVFKYPGDSGFPSTGPHKNHVPMNYIKRLIGESGETIAIRGGKLYYYKGLHYDDYEKATRDPELMATLWQKEYMHCDDEEARDLFRKGQFQIIRKSPENILAMMRLVYDNDHPSKDRNLPPRWSIADGASWVTDQAHGFRLEGGHANNDTHWLRYQHLLRDNPSKYALIMDMMGYNTYQAERHREALLGKNWVGDLILECEATIDNPQGQLALELSRGVDRFQARWDLASGVCTLLRLHDDGEQKWESKLESKPTALSKKGTYRLRFANVDQRLCVWVDGELPFGDGVDYPAPAKIAPTKKNDWEPASIGVRGGGVAVHKLKLFRDTYYTVGGGCNNSAPSEPDVRIDETDPNTWGELNNPPLLTMYVQPEHFLCLGDNSPESSDGRSWGAVPKRLLLGRALLVYYPFGRAGRIR